MLVTQLVQNTPVYLAEPHLHEGDQVRSINGRGTDTLTSEEVVSLIESARDKCCGELVLRVKPKSEYLLVRKYKSCATRTSRLDRSYSTCFDVDVTARFLNRNFLG